MLLRLAYAKFIFMRHRSLFFFYLVFACLIASVSLAQADSKKVEKNSSSSDLSSTEALSNPIDSFSIMLKPQLQSSPLPAWISHSLNLASTPSLLEISLAPLSQQTSIDHFVLTVVFDDHGDGGPFIEWKKPNGDRTMLCGGLGVNGPAVGFNARKLLIPCDLAFDGGTVVIHHEGRFDQVISATLQTARTATIAVLGEENNVALLDEVENSISEDLAAGDRPPLKEGDVMKGRLMTIELEATTQQGGEFEFIVKSEDGLPDTLMLNTEVIGLDLESQMEVRVNDTFVGILNTAPFSLTSSELINTAGWNTPEDQPQFHLAGWRKAWLYLPGRLWKKGEENHILLSLPTPSSSPISLRNSTLDLHYDNNVSLGHSTTPLAKDLFRY